MGAGAGRTEAMQAPRLAALTLALALGGSVLTGCDSVAQVTGPDPDDAAATLAEALASGAFTDVAFIADTPEEAAFRAEARAWLDAHAIPRGHPDDFSSGLWTSAYDEATYIDRCQAWQRTLYDGGKQIIEGGGE